MADVLRLVVGLGNPGTKYEGTRHNIGFMALERMASGEGFSFRQQSKLHGLAAEHGIGESRLRLLMPQTYMNDSGRSIRAALDWFGFTPEQLLVLVDDMDIPLGRLRLRAQGSAGNPAERRARTVSHVLGPFSRAEQPEVDAVLDGVLEAIQRIQRQGLDRAGNWINGFRPASVG
jgi:PTH1 family peptidyl-tRNA hydrolase